LKAIPEIKIGVLGFQGAVSEHVEILNKTLKELGLKGQVFSVKTPEQLEEVRGLVIPGGESTTIGRLSAKGLAAKIVERAAKGMPILGTCAGLILMAKEVYDAKLGSVDQPILRLMDMRAVRNFFGRQGESFEAPLTIPLLGRESFPGVFIRAPVVEKVWGEAEPLATYNGKIVAVQQGRLLATAFHPELTEDLRLHKYFVKLILDTL
jgi:5'-phosphate synthase pdxT subunit